MNGQEYLNQISAENRPLKKSGGSGLSKSLIFKVALWGGIALIVIIIIGVILGGGKNKEKASSIELKLHLDTTAKVIQKYRGNIKSSILRSDEASLYSILTNTSSDVLSYLTETYKFKEKEIDKKVSADAAQAGEELDTELFKAKINGNLDNVFAHKMVFEISTLKNELLKIINLTKSSSYKEALNRAYDSLENLYDPFNDFSEAK